MIDYASIAVSRLTGQFENSPKLKALVAAIVEPLSAIELDAENLKNNRWIDTAIGQQLDGCGWIVGEKRQGRNDDDYRLALKFRVFVNTSKGTPNDIIKGLKLLTSPTDAQYIETYPATAILFTNGFFVGERINYEMQDLAPVGISNLPVMVSFMDNSFRFSRQPIPGELFVNNSNDYLTAQGSDIQLSQGGTLFQGSTLGGIVPAELDVGGNYLDIGGSTLAVYSPNHLNTIGHDNLTGVYQ